MSSSQHTLKPSLLNYRLALVSLIVLALSHMIDSASSVAIFLETIPLGFRLNAPVGSARAYLAGVIISAIPMVI
jgi:hypothetical protein